MTTFKQALLDSVLEEYSGIPEKESEIDIKLSDAFLRKSEKMIQSTERRKVWRYVNTTTKRVIMVALIIMLLTMTVFAIPYVIKSFIQIEYYSTGVNYKFTFDISQTMNAPEHIESVYYPTYIPSGYTEVSNQSHFLGVYAVWMDADGWMIFYMQESLPHDPEHPDLDSFNSEGTTISRISIDGYEIVRGVDDESFYYAWTNHEYLFTLICDNVLPEDELVKIFQSVAVDPDAEIIGAE